MRQLVVLPDGGLQWQQAPDPELFPAGVEIDVRATAVSPGTETSLIRRWRERGEGGRPLGYSGAGLVRRVGPEAEGAFAPGQPVACYGGPYTRHATRLVVPWTLAAPVPESVPLEEAAFCGLGAIALHAVRRGRFSPGSRVIVLGMGILGQLQVQVLRAWGCRALAVDRRRERLEIARALGCADRFDNAEGGLAEAARAFAPDGADGVIVNTPLQPPMTDQAAECCRERGRIVLVGGGGEIRISRDHVFARELDLLISRAGGPGRYDAQYERQGRDLPPGLVRWTEGRNTAHFVEMVAAGQLNVAGLITHRLPREQAPQAFEMLGSEERRYAAMGVVFLYGNPADGAPTGGGGRPSEPEPGGRVY